MLAHAGAALAPRVAHNGVSTLAFTSGSTGRPKAAALTHTAFHAASSSKAAAVGYCSSDVYLHAAPLCHVGGLSSAHAILSARGAHVFPPSGAFRPLEAASLIRRHAVTALICVPTTLFDLVGVAASPHGGGPFTTVRRLLLGGGAVLPSAAAAAAAAFPCARIVSTYAMTEACSTLSFRTLFDPNSHKNVSGGGGESLDDAALVGDAAPGVALRLDPTTLEIQACGEQLMRGYWPLASSPDPAVFTADGWFRTGDLGRRSSEDPTDARIYFVGRASASIRTGGEAVHPSEVEAALCSHPAVLAAVIVGIPHDRWGAEVVAAVLLRPDVAPPPPASVKSGCAPSAPHRWRGPWAGRPDDDGRGEMCSVPLSTGGGGDAPLWLSPEALRLHVAASGLARFKAPRRIAAWGGSGGGGGGGAPSFPVGPTGKVDRAAVAAALERAFREQQPQLAPAALSSRL